MVLLALVVTWVLFVPAADWLAHHDVGSVTGALHETALDNARGRLLTLGAGLFAAGALIFTAQNFVLSRRTVELSRRTFELTEQGQVTDRYTKAIEQLGSDKLDVRIGGIYALERVARDSARDHPTVVEVLAAFVREHSREPLPADDEPRPYTPRRLIRADVQAAVTVIGRRDTRHDRQPVNLTRAILTGADLARAGLAAAILIGADLTGAELINANLAGANLLSAILTGANLPGANLAKAILTGVDLTHADLTNVNLAHVDLTGVNLGDSDLTGVMWPRDEPTPEGWRPDPVFSVLQRSSTRSTPAEAD